MPRTSAVVSPGCPPLRVLTTDVLGLVKVVEARGKDRIPKVVDTWGLPDGSRGIVAASFADRETQPMAEEDLLSLSEDESDEMPDTKRSRSKIRGRNPQIKH